MEAALGRRGRRLLPLLLPLIAALHLSPSAALPLGQVREGRGGGSLGAEAAGGGGGRGRRGGAGGGGCGLCELCELPA